MHARTFAVLATAAVALAAYASWIALDRTGDASHPPKSNAPAPDPKPVPDSVPVPDPEPPNRRDPTPVEPVPDPDPEPAPNQITPFDSSRELYHQAADTLRSGRSLDEAGTKALLEQARLAVKDMNALLEPGDEAQKRDLQRATEDLARLQARYP